MAPKGSVGWVILAASLAVPGLLFYQWYARLDRAQKRELNLKVRSPIPEGGPFAEAPAEEKLVNPIAAGAQASLAPAPGAPQAPSQAAPPVEPEQPAQPQAASTQPVAAAGPPAPEAAPTLPPAAAPAASGPGESPAPPQPPAALQAEAPAQASSAPAANPFLAWRDPTLSPYDRLRLERMELERRRRLEDMRAAAVRAKRPKTLRELGFDKNIHLQGIVSGQEGGNRAIINGEVVREGDHVGAVRVLRITPQGVVFIYKNTRFTKSMNR